ncbi:MAG: hypothetical protein ABIF82_08040, partial [Planctomycetota bacterium]
MNLDMRPPHGHSARLGLGAGEVQVEERGQNIVVGHRRLTTPSALLILRDRLDDILEESSAMTGKENYTRAVEFGGPERLPVAIAGDLTWRQEKAEAKAERSRELQSQFVGDVFGAG